MRRRHCIVEASVRSVVDCKILLVQKSALRTNNSYLTNGTALVISSIATVLTAPSPLHEATIGSNASSTSSVVRYCFSGGALDGRTVTGVAEGGGIGVSEDSILC